MRTVVLIPGDGIGQEITEATLSVLSALRTPVRFHVVRAGEAAVMKGEEPLPKATLTNIRKWGAALKGPLATPIAKGYQSVNVALRQELDLYANVRPISGRSLSGKRVDLVIVRENTEDLYAGIEFSPKRAQRIRKIVQRDAHVRLSSDAAVALKVISRTRSRKIASFAFQWARKNKRRSVAIIHKANILKETDGLFLREARSIAGRYPRLRSTEHIVDNAAQQLVMRPEQFDVLLCPNLYGDILSDLAGGLIGGIGLLPSAQIGKNAAVFEPVHGTAPDIAGKRIANPSAMMLSAAMMLEYIGETHSAKKIRTALLHALARPSLRTRDRGGRATTNQFTRGVIRLLPLH